MILYACVYYFYLRFLIARLYFSVIHYSLLSRELSFASASLVVAIVIVVIALPVSRIALSRNTNYYFFLKQACNPPARGRQQAQYRRVSLLGCDQTM